MAVEDVSAHVDLAYASDLLASGGPAAMYNYLASNGYLYANLANGVANGGSLAGDAALNHMQEVAAESGHPLTVADINKIRSNMATAYLDALHEKQDNGDFSDITWREAWTFHSQTFIQNHLPPDAWTLNTPFSVMTDAERADLWQRSLEAAGNPGKEAALAFTLAAAMSDQAGLLSAASPDENFMRELAEGLTDVRHQSPEQVAAIQHWLAINAVSYDNLENFIGALGKWSEDFSRSIKAQINNDMGVLIDSLGSAVNDAEALASPLILDLDGDGVETIGLSANVYFDHDANGFSENTGWVGRDDGLLVFDRNSNGAIDDGAELFGNNSKLPAGDKAANGFSALSALDTNSDGRIDIADADYANLRVWRDADSDGETDEGELFTLAEAGVQSINLSYVVSGVTDTSGNQHQQLGTYTRTDGTTSVVEDVWFAADLAQTVEKNKVDVSESIRAMPDIAGAGNVHSLRQAMSRDSSLVLLVQQFELASDPITRNSLVDQILFTWTGAIKYSANSRGDNIGDGRKLYALEAFLGTSYSQQNWGSSPGPLAAEILLKAYSQLTASINGQLMLQTHLKPLTDLLSITAENGVLKWDVSAVVASFQAQYSIAPDQALQMLQDFGLALRTSKSDSHEAILEAIRQKGNIDGSALEAGLATIIRPGVIGSKTDDIIEGADLRDDALYGLAGNDILRGFGGDDYIVAGAGNDILDGGSGSNQLFGEAGDDLLKVSSDSKNNLLVGGSGSDSMTGGYFSDTYLFNLGDGQDTITDYDAGYVVTDTLRFGAGILASDIQVQKSGTDVVFMHRNGTDQIRVKGWFSSTASSADVAINNIIERVEFADGTSWTWAEIAAAGLNQVGTAAADTLVGWSGNDIIRGGAGNDTLSGGAGANQLYGDAGDDIIAVATTSKGNTLAGGTGNDTLTGGYYADTYVFNLGDGQDTITDYDAGYVVTDTLRFGAGILASDIQVQKSGTDVVFMHRNGTDQIRVKGWFDSTASSAGVMINNILERVEFADGTSWTWAEIAAAGLNQVGTTAADTLVGWSGNDIIRGGAGNDTLSGGTGANQLYGDAGDDIIAVATTSKGNTLAGGTGNDTLTGGYYADTYVFNLGDGQDIITDYDGGNTATDTLRFGAGILASDINTRRVNSDLVFMHVNGTDQLTFKGWFDATTSGAGVVINNVIERVEFADGTIWTWADIVATGLKQVGSEGAETLTGWSGNDIIRGGGGNDTLLGGAGANQLYGDAGDDTITVATSSKGNTLVGGTGNDTLTGGYYADTYVFNLGDGQDTITDYDGGNTATDTLRFGAGILASDINTRRVSSDLVFMHVNGTDQLTFKGWFDATTSGAGVVISNVIERVEFADGTIWTWADIVATGLKQVGSEGAETLTGWSGNDIIHGGGGNDTLSGGAGANQLYGDAGDDALIVAAASKGNTLAGGAGNDTITGGNFSDTYLFNLGDGQDIITDYDAGYAGTDTLRFGAGILASDIQVQKSGTDVVFMHRNGTDQIRVKGWFNSTASSADVAINNILERVEFADGTSWTWADIAAAGLNQVGTAAVDTLVGWAGNDIIRGGAGNDTLSGGTGANQLYGDAGDDVVSVAAASKGNILAGGTGNDTITGGNFSDTYLFNRGDGQDTITDYDGGYVGTDILAFGADINPQDLWLRHTGSNLEITVIGSSEKLTVSNWYQSSNYHVEALKTADGKVLLDSQVQSLVDTMASFGVAPGAETNLTNDQRTQLDAVLAANWK